MSVALTKQEIIDGVSSLAQMRYQNEEGRSDRAVMVLEFDPRDPDYDPDCPLDYTELPTDLQRFEPMAPALRVLLAEAGDDPDFTVDLVAFTQEFADGSVLAVGLPPSSDMSWAAALVRPGEGDYIVELHPNLTGKAREVATVALYELQTAVRELTPA